MKQKKVLNKQNAYRFKRFSRKAYSTFNSMSRVVNIGVITACTLTFAHSTPTSAQSIAPEGEKKEKSIDLDEVMVTASRIEAPVAQTPKVVTIISRKQIEQSPAQSVQELLAYVANIDVLQRGSKGVQTDITIRGGSFDQTAVLLNGINLSNAQTGHYNYDFPINLSDIERIEIVSGSSALIYGSSAFSGGINIITKKDVAEKIFMQMEAGMHSQRNIEARGAMQTGIFSHSISASTKSSDGYQHNTGYNMYNLLWQSRLNLKNKSKIDLLLGYNNKEYGANSFYTAAFPDQYEYTSTYMGTVKGEFGTKLKFIPILYRTRHYDQFDLIKDSVYGRNYHRGDTYGANLILRYTSGLGTTSIGSEIRQEDIISSKLGKKMTRQHGKYIAFDDRTNISATLEHTIKYNDLILSAGILMNHNSFLSGSYRFYPSVSASYRLIEPLTISSSWSKSSRMPTFTELYYNTETHSANENLIPEKSESLDLSLKYNRPFIQANLTGFLLWGHNLIDWIKETADSKATSSNITKVNTQGIEANVRFKLSEICSYSGNESYLSLGYTHLWQDYESGIYISESKNKLNYLRDKFTAQLNHKIFDGLSAGWYFRYQKRLGAYTKYENNKNTGEIVPYPEFTTLDLKINYKYKSANFNLSFNNLYDTRYVDLGNIELPGFWFSAGMNYKF
jgi:iron complex outermembrane receptor protein